jgi:(E)-4-hydroxy-3-methylbut-2-enyl-diphosphate synthase
VVVDLQENYRLAASVAPYVDKIRYNRDICTTSSATNRLPTRSPGWWRSRAIRHRDPHRRQLRLGGTGVPRALPDDQLEAIVQSALYHCQLMEDLGFDRFVVSLKDSDPDKVIAANRRFAAARPDVPLHLGVTEAGLPPQGIIKTRVAFEKLLAAGIGDTLRVSLTLPNERKHEEVEVGFAIVDDVRQGRFISVPDFGSGLNIISCPSCSRVENDSFVQLAEQVRDLTAYASTHRVTIAVMGCRVNGPGETDDADLGLWCGPSTVTLKRKDVKVGSYSYSEVLVRLKAELDRLIQARAA